MTSETPDRGTTPPVDSRGSHGVVVGSSNTQINNNYGPIVVVIFLIILLATTMGALWLWRTHRPGPVATVQAPVPAGNGAGWCAAATGVDLQNHDSRLFLNTTDPATVGDAREAISIAPVGSGGPAEDCLVNLLTAAGGQRAPCLEVAAAAPGSMGTWATCTDRTNQRWVMEDHWTDLNEIHWRRFHPLDHPALCLQQADKGGLGTPLTVQDCGSGWLQQWRLMTH